MLIFLGQIVVMKIDYSTSSWMLCFVLCFGSVSASHDITCTYSVDDLLSRQELTEYVGTNEFIGDMPVFYDNYLLAYCSAVHYHDLRAQAHALNQIAFYHYSSQQYTKAMDLLLVAYEHSELADYKQGLADYHCYMGLIRQEFQNTEQSLMHFRYLKQLGEEEGNVRWEADGYVNIGSVYLAVGDLDEAESCFRTALQKLKDGPMSETVGWAEVHLGSVQVARGDTLLGFVHYKEAVKVWQEHGVSRGLAHIYNEMGRMLAGSSPDESLRYHRQALRYARASNFKSQELFGYLKMGELYLESDVDSAVVYLEKVVQLSGDGGNHWLRKAASAFLVDIYSVKDVAKYEQYLEVSYLTADKIIDQLESEFKNWLRLDSRVLDLEKRTYEQQIQNEVMVRYSKRLWLLVLLLSILTALAIYYAYKFFVLNRSFDTVNRQLNSSVKLLEQQSEILADNNKELNEQKKTLSNQLHNRLAIIRDHQMHRNKLSTALHDMQMDDKDRRQLLKIITDGGNVKLLQSIDEEMKQINSSLFSELMKRHPQLTANNLRLLSYVKMNLSNKEIADLLYISTASLKVAKSRLTKRMNVPEGMSLTAYLHSME